MSISNAKFIAFLSIVFSCTTSYSQPADNEREQDHEQLRALLESVTDAVNNDDLDRLAPLLHEDLSITMVDQTLLTDLSAVKDYFFRLFRSEDAILDTVVIEPKADALTDFIGDDVGVSRGSSRDTYTLKNGRSVILDTRWSGVVVKDSGQWKIRSLHIGTDLLDNPVVAAAERLNILWGIGGLVIGAIAVLLIQRGRRVFRG